MKTTSIASVAIAPNVAVAEGMSATAHASSAMGSSQAIRPAMASGLPKSFASARVPFGSASLAKPASANTIASTTRAAKSIKSINSKPRT